MILSRYLSQQRHVPHFLCIEIIVRQLYASGVNNLDQFLEMVKQCNDAVSKVVWGPAMLLLLLFTGILFTVWSKFFQFTNCKLWMQHTAGSFFHKKSKKTEKNKSGISAFQAMTTALAGAIGTGNIVGVATAITLGGAGSIFWMWVASLFGMMTIFAENILGVKYRRKNTNGEYVGGPMYYIEYGLKQKWMAILFAIFCMIATLGMGNMTQANSIAGALYETFSIEPKYTGLILCLLVGSIIFGGVGRIAKFSEKIVPFMAFFYLAGGLIVIFVHAKALPGVFSWIVKDAFSFSAAAGGGIGFLTSHAIKYGIARGVFSNEAGLGSSPIIYAASEEKEPVVQGMWGIFQVFFDTIIGCSVTALCILCSGAADSGKDGVALSTAAFETVFGQFGSIFVTVSIAMFAFATMVGWSYYGERSLEYIAGEKFIPVYKAFYAIMILFGCVMDLNLVWDLSDTFNGLMAIPNLIALLFLSKEVMNETKDYQKKLSKRSHAKK